MSGPLLPRNHPEWMKGVEAKLAGLRTGLRAVTNVPVGGLVLLAPGVAVPPRWLLANGAGFDPEVWPELADHLGGTTTPTLANLSGCRWVIRAG